MPNIENLIALRDWLSDGAQHVRFDMHEGIRLTRYDPDEKTACGTVCCIAGAAYQMATVGLTDVDALIRENADIIGTGETSEDAIPWSEIEPVAAAWLGLEPDHEPDAFIHHSLFDPAEAPEHCTPQQAADAVQRVIDGQPAWPDED